MTGRVRLGLSVSYRFVGNERTGLDLSALAAGVQVSFGLLRDGWAAPRYEKLR